LGQQGVVRCEVWGRALAKDTEGLCGALEWQQVQMSLRQARFASAVVRPQARAVTRGAAVLCCVWNAAADTTALGLVVHVCLNCIETAVPRERRC
jgi:hypothetical protein